MKPSDNIGDVIEGKLPEQIDYVVDQIKDIKKSDSIRAGIARKKYSGLEKPKDLR